MLNEHFHTLGRILKHPKKGRDEIVLFQNRKLRSVIRNAYHNVAYYRDLFNKAGIKPEDIRTAEDLRIVPITSSQEYRMRGQHETLSGKISIAGTVHRATSGSTGRPFIIRRSPLEDHLMNAFRIRAFRQFGVRLSDKLARIRLVSSSHRRENTLGRIRQGIGVYREYSIDSLQSPSRIVQELSRLGPDIIRGYPAVLSHIAPSVAKAGTSRIRPRFLISGGESLIPVRRQAITNGFGSRIFDIYGAHEFNVLAWECPETDEYHICDDNVIVEILRDGRPAKEGERGEVVATGLHSYSMPFIRYRVGDIVTRGREMCSCGQPFSTLRAIQGRMHDYFRMPDGNYVHPDDLIVPIMESDSSWFDQYRLIQEREDFIALKVKPFFTPSKHQLRRVEDIARNKLPDGVEFRIDLVKTLSFQRSGKFRFCRSMVKSDCEGFNWDNL